MTWTPTRPPVALRAGAAVAALAVSGALLLGACSSSSGSPSAAAPSGSGTATAVASASGGPADTGDSGGDQRQAMEAYRQCLGQHGVTLPTFDRPSGGVRPSGRPSGGTRRGGYGFPGTGPGGAGPDAATQKAMNACASLRPQFKGRGGAGGTGSSAFKAFASCLKDHGVVLPTASPGTRGYRGPGLGLNTAEPTVGAAYAVCKALLPSRPSPSTSS